MDTRDEIALFLFQTDRSIYPQVHDTFCDLTGEDKAWFLALADGFLASSVVAHTRAEAWDEGAKWAAVECNAIDDESEPWLAPGDNPYRARIRESGNPANRDIARADREEQGA